MSLSRCNSWSNLAAKSEFRTLLDENCQTKNRKGKLLLFGGLVNQQKVAL